MRFLRTEPRVYQSEDGSYRIVRVLSRQTGRPDETCWTMSCDGKWVGDYDLLRDAKEDAWCRWRRQNGMD